MWIAWLQKYAAPFVADGGDFDCNDCEWKNNIGGEEAGAVFLYGKGRVNMTGVRD